MRLFGLFVNFYGNVSRLCGNIKGCVDFILSSTFCVVVPNDLMMIIVIVFFFIKQPFGLIEWIFLMTGQILLNNLIFFG